MLPLASRGMKIKVRLLRAFRCDREPQRAVARLGGKCGVHWPADVGFPSGSLPARQKCPKQHNLEYNAYRQDWKRPVACPSKRAGNPWRSGRRSPSSERLSSFFLVPKLRLGTCVLPSSASRLRNGVSDQVGSQAELGNQRLGNQGPDRGQSNAKKRRAQRKQGALCAANGQNSRTVRAFCRTGNPARRVVRDGQEYPSYGGCGLAAVGNEE